MQHQTRRSRRLGASLLVALLASASQAFAPDVSIVPKLRAGDAFQLEVIRIREHSTQPQQNSKSTNRVDVRVLSATSSTGRSG